MATTHPFEQRLTHAWPPAKWRGETTILAVSGGPDSVALLRAMATIGRGIGADLRTAHYNHHLRGAESDADEAFVRQLSDEVGLVCEVGRADTAVTPGGDGVEAKARDQRYAFLRQVADRLGARYLVTAHTADDQAETILHRVIRGTGLRGLAGIPVTRRLSQLTTVVRPLLAIKREMIQDYLDDLSQPSREDSSNQLSTFTRNRIRHELMPALVKNYNPQVAEALTRLGRLASDAQKVVDELVEGLCDECVATVSESRVEIDRALLATTPPYLVRELLIEIWKRQRWPQQDMSGLKWHQLSSLVRDDSQSGEKATFPGRIQAHVRGETLELSKQAP